MNLVSATLSFAQDHINRALHTDALTLQRLESLAGKSLAVNSSFPPMVVHIIFSEQGVELINPTDSDQAASVQVSGSSLALARFFYLASLDHADLSDADVDISGDAGTLLQISRCFADVDIDWEELLSQIIGVVPANIMAEQIRQLIKALPYVASKAQEQGSQAIKTTLDLPSNEELKSLKTPVRDLSYGIDRLQARLNLITSSMQVETK